MERAEPPVDPGVALVAAMQEQDWPQVVRIIEASWRWLFRHAQPALARALALVPAELAAGSTPTLALQDLRRRIPDELFTRIVPSLPDDPGALAALGTSEAAADTLDFGNLVLMLLRRRGLIQRALRYGDQLETVLHSARRVMTPRLADIAATTALQIGITRMLADDAAGARRAFHGAYDFTLDAADETVRKNATGKLALSYAAAGDVRRAEAWLQRHEQADLALPGDWIEHVVGASATCARRLVALERLDLPAAAAAEPTENPNELDEFRAFFAFTATQYMLFAGDPAAGLHALVDHRRVEPTALASTGATDVLLVVAEADLLMALGRGHAAANILAGAADAGHPAVRVGRARLALLSGDTETAVALAREPGLHRESWLRWQQDLLLIQAIGLLRLGAADRAVELTRRAVATAASHGAYRVFATVPRAELDELLAALPAGERPAGLERLPAVFPDRLTVVTLAEREREILTLLAAGLTRAQIAQRLFISANTLKYHLRGLYRKLDATNRREAVRSAEVLGLLRRES